MTEIDKYLGIYANPVKYARYGHSNHGARATSLLVKWGVTSVLDVGCGWNEFCAGLRSHLQARVVGVDFACPGADIRAAVTALPFADNEFDTVTSFDMLEHLRPEEVDDALKELARVACRFVFSISYVPSVNKWEGQTLHPTVRGEEWWMTRLMRAGAFKLQKIGKFITGQWGQKLNLSKEAKVILVGNGPSLLEGEQGAMIDSFDEVVRFNNYHIEGFEKHTGTRTTLWSTFFKRIDTQIRHGRVLCVHEGDNPSQPLSERYLIPSWFYERANRDLQRRADWKSGFDRDMDKKLLATSGLLVASFLIEVVGVRQITLAGFDHFSKSKSSLHHYWINKAYKQPPEHNGSLEEGMFAELKKVGKIEYLVA